MSHPGRIIRRAFIGLAYGGSTLAAIFFGAVAIKAVIHAEPVRAASAAIYPSFCLGGWDHPQHASGPSHADSPALYNSGNSAFLASDVSSQLFCGYFDIADKVNPPSSVQIKFAWDMRGAALNPASAVSLPVSTSTPSAPGAVPSPAPSAPSSSFQSSTTSDSYTTSASTSPIISPATGLIPVSLPSTPTSTQTQAATSSAASGSNQAPNPAAAPAATPASAPADSASVPAAPAPSASASSAAAPAAQAAPAAPAATPAPAPAPAPATPAATTPSSAPDSSSAAGPTSFLQNLFYALGPEIARASASDPAHSAQPFFNISYSVDGVRWVSVGTVGLDNWKGYAISIPVSSWDDVRHLQIMINVMPTVDPKPDVYLESIAAQAEYSRTTKEAISDAASAVTGAVSNLADAVVGSSGSSASQDEADATSTATSTDATLGEVADALKALPVAVIAPLVKPTPPPVFYLSKRVLQFASAGAPLDAGPRSDIKPIPSADGSSLTLSGSCTKKYYVVLVYKTAMDYEKKQSSFVANEARDCVGGSFTYDVSALPPELRDGTYYIMTADEDDTGPWIPSSKIFPVTIHATTTQVQVSSQ